VTVRIERVGVIVGKVPTAKIIHVPIAVVIHTGCAVHLRRILPDVLRQVGMIVVNSRVDHGDDDFRASMDKIPCLWGGDIL
jgi:hypothetical protein